MVELSWSRYSTFTLCPLAYSLKYDRKVRSPRRVPYRRFVVGLVVHKVLQEWAVGGFEPKFLEGALAGIFRQLTAKIRYLSKQDYLKDFNKAQTLTQSAQGVYWDLGIPSHEVLVEPKLRVPIEGVLGEHFITGSWDLLDVNSGAIYDVKTSKSKAFMKQGQLLLYGLAARAMGYDVKRYGFITPAMSKRVHAFDFNDAVLDSFHGDIVKAVETVDKGVQPVPNVGKHCSSCDYWKTPLCSATDLNRGRQYIRSAGKRKSTISFSRR